MPKTNRLDPAEWMVERVFDESLHTELPRLLGRSSIDAILELVSNSHDADATFAEVTYDPKNKTLTVKDDGEGMGTPERFAGFFRRGGSEKLKERVTKKGRNKAGRDVPLPEVVAADSSWHGTTIELRDLKREIDLEGLVERIAREAPLLDNFKVYVNNKEVTLPRIDEAEVFIMREEVPGVGMVQGQFYLSPIKLTQGGGVYLKVNNRAVGDPSQFFTKSMISAAAMRQRLLAFVHADGLDLYISFDRTRFDEDEPHVIAVKKKIVEFSGIVRRSYDAIIDEERRLKQRKGYFSVVEAVQRRFNRADKEFLPRGECTFELTQTEEHPYPVEIDLDARKVYVHTPHPFFIGMRSPHTFRTALVGATALAMARTRIKTRNIVPDPESLDRAFRRSLEIFHDQGNRFNHVLYGAPAPSPFSQPEIIEPSKLYDLEELAARTSLDSGTIREMVSSGVITQTSSPPTLIPEKKTHVEGRSIRAALHEMSGYKLLAQIVAEVFPSISPDERFDVAEEVNLILSKDDSLDVHVKDIGKQKPFYIVKEEAKEIFAAYLRAHGGMATKKMIYGEMPGRHPIFIFSMRVPREHRDDPETFYKTGCSFLDKYLKQDHSARIRSCYIAEEGRIVGSILSFEAQVLRQQFNNIGFEQGNGLTMNIYAAEYEKHRVTSAGTNRFSTEVPEHLRVLFKPFSASEKT